MILVDELVGYGQAPKEGAERYFGNGKQSCHMSTDGDIEELHVFAEKIGLRRAWFQNERLLPHYDLTPNKQRVAVLNGAQIVTARELLARCSRHPDAEIRETLRLGWERAPASR